MGVEKTIIVRPLDGNKIQIEKSDGTKEEKQTYPDYEGSIELFSDGEFVLRTYTDLSNFVISNPPISDKDSKVKRQHFCIGENGVISKADEYGALFYPEQMILHNYDSPTSTGNSHNFDADKGRTDDDLKLTIAPDNSKYTFENEEYKIEFSVNKYIFSAGQIANSLFNNQYFETGMNAHEYLNPLNKEVKITKKDDVNGQSAWGELADYLNLE